MYNMMNGNGMMMNGGMMTPGMMGGPQYAQQQAKMTQPLTKEEIAKLKNTGNAKLVVDEIDLLRAKCTHKQNGQLTLQQNSDGSHTCSLCGQTFNLVDTDPAEVEAITARMIDVLQSIKTFYLDMPVNYASEFFVMIPLLKNTPTLYKIALNQFSKYETGSVVNQANPMYGFGLLNTITSPMGMQPGMGMMQQQPYGMQPQGYGMQPQMQPQMMQPGMGMPTDPYGNPIAGNPFTGQMVQPQTTGMTAMQQTAQQIDNQVAQQQDIQQQNNGGQQVTTSKTFNV